MAEKKPVKITETVLRDAHQSLIATRMTTEQMLPIIDKLISLHLPVPCRNRTVSLLWIGYQKM